MNNISTTTDKIKKMYSKLGYFDEYGTSIMFFIILTIIVILIVSYTSIMENIQPIKDNWSNERCKPNIMPFAGLINKNPADTTTEYTAKNFQYCLTGILSKISGYAVDPIYAVLDIFADLAKEISKGLQMIRTIIANIRTELKDVAIQIYKRIENFVIALQMLFVKLKDTMGKIHGSLVTALFTSMGSYLTLMTVLGSVTELMIGLLISLASIIIALWILPFTWPMAATMTAIFVAISIPLAKFVYFVEHDLGIIPGKNMPSQPSCFDSKTTFKMNDSSIKSIKDIKIGDQLADKTKCTSKITIRATDKLYKLGKTFVTGDHFVKYKNKWISVKSHPNAILQTSENEENIVYCLNTNSKLINHDNNVFSDWDELCNTDIELVLRHIYNISYIETNKKEVYKYLEGGFVNTTPIKLKNNTIKNISDVTIGDELSNGEKVIGLVEIDGSYVNGQYKFYLGDNKYIEGGNNIIFYNYDNLPISTIALAEKTIIKKHKYLYHLLTDVCYFHVGNLGDIKVGHYTSNTEYFD
jgi:hypothetical protein